MLPAEAAAPPRQRALPASLALRLLGAAVSELGGRAGVGGAGTGSAQAGLRRSSSSVAVAAAAAAASGSLAGGFRFMSPEQLAAFGDGAATFSVPPWVFLAPADAAAAAAAPPTPAEAAATAAALADGGNFRAQDGEDRFALNAFFADRRGGLILETGALDGLTYSVSWLFERALGWRAVHVEASENNYAALLRNRPAALNIHAALCREPASVHLVAQSGDKQAVGGIFEFMAEGFRNRIWPGVGVDALPAVACLPLAPLLALFGITHVDFWVLDVEGAELEVLRATDFSKVSFGAIVIETDGHAADKDREVVTLLEAQGFVNYGLVERNTWLVSRDLVMKRASSAGGGAR